MANIVTKIYNKMPIAGQNLAVSLYGWRWEKRRFGGVFQSELAGFIRRETYDWEQWFAYQTVELRRLLVHAFETVPYDRRVYSAAGFSIDDFLRFELDHASASSLPGKRRST